MYDTLRLLECLSDQASTGCEGGGGSISMIPVQYFHVTIWCVAAAQPHQRCGVGARHATEQEIDQLNEEFVIVVGTRNDARKAAEYIDALIGVSKLDALQEIRGERLLVIWSRNLDCDPYLGVHERKRRVADDEVLVGAQRKPASWASIEVDGIGSLVPLLNFKGAFRPAYSGVLSGNLGIPGDRPVSAGPSKHDWLVREQAPSPAELRLAALHNQIRHVCHFTRGLAGLPER